MAHFAELDNNNIVLRVLVVGNDITTTNPGGVETEQWGINHLKGMFGQQTKWVQTSYNTSRGQHSRGKPQNRKNYAGVGYKYDITQNAFIAPQPFLSWILDNDTGTYEAPVPYPDNDQDYVWDEESLSWVLEQ